MFSDFSETARTAHLNRAELSRFSFDGWNQAPEQVFIRLRRFVKHPSFKGRSQQVVGGRDGVDVASEVQVELFHWNHLRVTAACSAALDAEGRAL